MGNSVVQQPSRPYIWKVPANFMGTRMYPVLPGMSAGEIAAMKEYVEDMDDSNTDCSWLGFVDPCPNMFHIRPTFGGSEPCLARIAAPHGHFVHWGDSGTAILQVAVSSRPFFDFALAQLPELGNGFGFPEGSVAVFTALLAEERAKLLPELAEHEQPFLEGKTFAEHVTANLVWIG